LDTPQQEASVAPAAKNSDSPAPAAQNGDGAPAAGQVRLLYAPDVDELADTAQKQLDEIVQKLNGDENLRVQIFAYASGAPDAESNARRKSLARGLNVRAYLIKAGIRSTRIEIRALGSKVPDGGPADRVDVAPLAS
jgi:outer membrane protein OmpA-like peptidoglycan-associated protein